jgi:hypothetical protein
MGGLQDLSETLSVPAVLLVKANTVLDNGNNRFFAEVLKLYSFQRCLAAASASCASRPTEVCSSFRLR